MVALTMRPPSRRRPVNANPEMNVRLPATAASVPPRIRHVAGCADDERRLHAARAFSELLDHAEHLRERIADAGDFASFSVAARILVGSALLHELRLGLLHALFMLLRVELDRLLMA
jgi:hypothetical protein